MAVTVGCDFAPHVPASASADDDGGELDSGTADEVEAIQHTVGHYQALGLYTLGYDFLLDDDGTWRISEIN
ncbi:MAG: hypothetical protein AAGC55_28850, partial [Myxococcota bacterium]